MGHTTLSNFILKILKFREKKLNLFRKTGSTTDTAKIIDMSTGGEEKEDDSKWIPPDQKYRPNKDEKRKLLNMDIQINPDQSSNTRLENPNKQKQDNSLLLLVLRILICIFVINLSLWGYFKFIKGVSFTEGVIGWQTSVQEFLNFQDKHDHPKLIANQEPKIYPKNQTQNHPKLIVKQEPITYPRKQTYVASNSEPKIIKNYFYKIDLVNGGKLEGIRLIDKGDSYQIFSKEGIVTEIHKGRVKKIDKLELVDGPYFETRFINRGGGTIILPVTVSNNGHKERIRLILDTGCSTTQIHPDVVKRLKVEIKDRGKVTIADGRKIDSFYATVDSLEVGPFKELNFTISTNYIENKGDTDGLLGMNFLRKHQFDIDTKRQVVRWK